MTNNTPPDPAVLRELIERVVALGDKVPCDVLVPPATLIRAGCDWITLLEAIEARREAKARGWPVAFSASLRAHTSTPTMVENGNG